MTGRLIFRGLVAVAALYALIAMAASLARIPSPDLKGDAGRAPEAAVNVFDAELHDLRSEGIVP